MKTGFIEPKLDSTQFIMGSATSLSKDVLQADGQWDNYLPVEERQHGQNYDTYGCTIWGTLNAYEILENKFDSFNKNYDERFVYNGVPVRPPGADPHIVAEFIRKNGLIENRPLPDTFEEFCNPTPPESIYFLKGLEFLEKYSIGHEWVFTGDVSNRIELMKQALQYSPLGVSVSGWYEKDGVYVDMGQPNGHWTVIYGWNDKGWKCFDSYEPYRKIISFDHKIRFCKRYSLTPKQAKETWLINTLKWLIKLIKPIKSVPNTIPTTPHIKSPRERLYEMAVFHLGKDASPQDVAPDEFGCAETVNEIYYKTFKEYIESPGISTTKLFASMVDRPDKFVRVTDAECGTIIISPTGFSSLSNTPIKNGHVGIFGKDNKIMSSSSATGKFEENYTIDTWIERYRSRGGYPIYYFKPI